MDQISGPIRLSAPLDLGRNRLTPIIDAFLTVYPQVSIDLILNDGYMDMVAEGIDFAIRYGNLASSSLKIKKLHQLIACHVQPRLILKSMGALKRHMSWKDTIA